MEVIGFVPDIKFASFRTEVVPMAFLVRGKSYSGGAAFAYIKVKAGSDMGAAMAHVKNVKCLIIYMKKKRVWEH